MRMRNVIIVLCTIVFSLPVSAAIAAVTTTNNGDGTTSLKATYSVPTTSVSDVRDDICRGSGWTATVTCTQAMVNLSQCTAGQLNTQITNPETCLQAIDRTIRTLLRDLRKAGEVQEAEDTFIKPVKAVDHGTDIQ